MNKMKVYDKHTKIVRNELSINICWCNNRKQIDILKCKFLFRHISKQLNSIFRHCYTIVVKVP